MSSFRIPADQQLQQTDPQNGRTRSKKSALSDITNKTIDSQFAPSAAKKGRKQVCTG
jgi:hypothetical protein